MKLSGPIGGALRPKTVPTSGDLVEEVTRQTLRWLELAGAEKDPVNALVYASYAVAWTKIIKMMGGEGVAASVARTSFVEIEKEAQGRQHAAVGAIPADEGYKQSASKT